MTTDDYQDHAGRFGEEHVGESRKEAMVGAVFGEVAESYDLMNDLMSAGVHRLWKHEMVTLMARDLSRGRIIDVAGGTGDVAFALARRGFRVDVVDINRAMIDVSRSRRQRGVPDGSLSFVCGRAEALPYRDGSLDGCTNAFGIRNVTHIDRALAEAFRVLRPGGRFLCLEFGRPARPIAGLYRRASRSVIPRLGALVAGSAGSYRYLVESIARFPDQHRFAAMVRDAGFSHVTTRNLSGGIAALTAAWRL